MQLRLLVCLAIRLAARLAVHPAVHLVAHLAVRLAHCCLAVLVEAESVWYHLKI